MTTDYHPQRAAPPRRRPVFGVLAGLVAVLLVIATVWFVISRPAAVPAAAPASVIASSPVAAPAATTSAAPTQAATSASATAKASQPTRQSVRISSVSNFRDVAADGIALDGGAEMATGLVYRAAKLATLSSADAARLASAGVSDIFDLRTPDVARRSPDATIKGAENHLINLYAVPQAPKPPSTNAAAAKEYMRGLYRGFVSDAEQRKRVASVLTGVAKANDPVIVHCSEGKDRTGWVSALLQYAAGADDATVLEQYLLSNKERATEIERSYASVKRASGATAADIDRALKTVEASYLKASLTEVEKRYGSIDGYLSEGLGISKATLDDLRAKLRVEAR